MQLVSHTQARAGVNVKVQRSSGQEGQLGQHWDFPRFGNSYTLPHPSDQLSKLCSLLLPQLQTKHLWGQWERGAAVNTTTATRAGPQPAHILGRRHPGLVPTRAGWKVKNQSIKELFCLCDTKITSCLHGCHKGLRAVLTEISSSDSMRCP